MAKRAKKVNLKDKDVSSKKAKGVKAGVDNFSAGPGAGPHAIVPTDQFSINFTKIKY